MKKKPVKPAKPPSIHDVTLRAAISDLLDRGQIPVLRNFSSELGFKQSNQVAYFLSGQRNYPKSKIDLALSVLEKKYKINRDFLTTGHGKMYKGVPYTIEDSLPIVEEPENFLTLGGKKQIIQLQKSYDDLKKQLAILEKMIKDKDDLIEAQKQLIKKGK